MEVSLVGTGACDGAMETTLWLLESTSASNLLIKVRRDDGGGAILVIGGVFARGEAGKRRVVTHGLLRVPLQRRRNGRGFHFQIS